MKATRLFHMAARNLMSRGHKIGVKQSLMETLTLKAMISHSKYNTITRLLRQEILYGYSLIPMSNHPVFQVV